MEQEWQEIKSALQASLPKGQYDLWVATLDCLGVSEERLLLGCRNRLHIEWLRERLEGRLLELARRHFPVLTQVEYRVMPDNPLEPAGDDDIEGNGHRQLSLADFQERPQPGFNRRFTFDRFVVGLCNQFAHATSLAMATGQELYHPCVYLLSETGLGKSHLSHAVGNYLFQSRPQLAVQYVTAEQFTNEMISSIKKDRMEVFKQKYRLKCDLLIMEQMEFLSGKEKIQKELVFTMDELMDRGKKILCTGNAYPRDIPRLSTELRSRLNGVLVAPIDRPDFHTRLAIVGRKLRDDHLQMPAEVMEFLADRITRDVRHLESCIVGVVAKSRIMGVPITLGLAEEVTKTMLDHLPKLTIEHIQKVVCANFQVTLEELKSPSRRKDIANARKIAMYLCRSYTAESLAAIGKAFARAHTSVLHAINTLTREMENKNNRLRRQVEQVSRRLEMGCLHSP